MIPKLAVNAIYSPFLSKKSGKEKYNFFVFSLGENGVMCMIFFLHLIIHST